MTLSDYHYLKQQVLLKAGESDKHSQILCALKEYYKDDIDSPRRYEQINTISNLIKMLEIRDVLSEDNVVPLKEVVSRLSNNRQLMQKIVEYESTHVPREYVNYYASDRHKNGEVLQAATTNQPIESFNNHPCGVISKRKRERILETITEELGIFWRDLARNLKIRECVIDEIDLHNKKLSRKASNLLEYYEERADPQRWFFLLCEALEKTRRKDLSLSIQDIMAMNI